MPISVELTVSFLERYADLASLVGMLPLVSHLKLDRWCQATDALHDEEPAAVEERKGSAAAAKEGIGKKEGAESEAKKVSDVVVPARREREPIAMVPPAVAVVLFMLAEVCSSTALFDPADKLVPEGVFEILSTLKQTPPGINNAFKAFEWMLKSKNVYKLVTFLSIFCGLGGILATMMLERAQLSMRKGGIISSIRGVVTTYLRSVLNPRAWCYLMCAVGFVLGNWTYLGNFFRGRAAFGVARHVEGLLRALAMVVTATRTTHAGPLPSWATAQCVGAAARFARIFVYERMSVAALTTDGVFKQDGSSNITDVLSNLAMEMFCLVIALVIAMRRARFVFLLPILTLPCVALAAEASMLGPIAPFMDAAIQKMSVVVAVVSIMLFFFGGVGAMLCGIMVVQALLKLHGILNLHN